MKKLLVLVMFLMVVMLPLQAQNIKVQKFSMLEKDMTASMHGTAKLDQNGEKAALIKIQAPEHGFTFDGGSLGIVAREEHDGEIWLYVPRRAKKLTIQHKDYGVLREYYYEVPIEGARTYEMFLDIGIGRYVTITSQIANSTIYIDGLNCGLAPINHRYLTYGRHTVRALKDRYEGEQTFMITTGDEQGLRLINIEQRDMSDRFGNVTVTVDNRADIYFEDRKVGTGTWKTQLREGSYVVETRKADCEPAKTSFTVTAQQNNVIKANVPVHYTGWLSVYTRPGNVKTYLDGSRMIDLTETVSLPIGTHQVEFSKTGYVSQNREYLIKHNETTRDTVTLSRVNYIKALAFYFGGALTVRSFVGATGILGAVFKRHDLQASYTFGLSESDVVFWGGDLNTGTKYKMQSLGVKYGYQVPLMRHLAITPQLGYSYNFLTAHEAVAGNTTYGNGASSQALTIGAKLVLVPMQHLYIFAAPEYIVALSNDKSFESITNSSNISADGFAVHAGVIVNF